MRLFLLFIAVTVSACNSNPTVIEIRSTPPGATVTEAVKGALGKTPVQLSFAQGDCQDSDGPCLASFYFSKQGYKDERVEKRIDGDRVMVHAYLQPIKR